MSFLDKTFQLVMIALSAWIAYKLLMGFQAPQWFAVAASGGQFVVSMLLQTVIAELAAIRKRLDKNE